MGDLSINPKLPDPGSLEVLDGFFYVGRLLGDETQRFDAEGRPCQNVYPTVAVFSCRACGSLVAAQAAHRNCDGP